MGTVPLCPLYNYVINSKRRIRIMRKRKKTWITSAHQGFVNESLHSNTLAAYELAAKKGADMIETDARMTRTEF